VNNLINQIDEERERNQVRSFLSCGVLPCRAFESALPYRFLPSTARDSPSSRPGTSKRPRFDLALHCSPRRGPCVSHLSAELR